MRYDYELHNIIVMHEIDATILEDRDTDNRLKFINRLSDGWEIYDKSIVSAGRNAIIQYIIRKEI